MPQLDQTSYFTQLTYFIIFFLLIFSFLTFYVIPKISSNLKFRYYLLSGMNNSFNKLDERKNLLVKSFDSDSINYMKNISSFFKKLDERLHNDTNTLHCKYIREDRKIVTERLDGLKVNHNLFSVK